MSEPDQRGAWLEGSLTLLESLPDAERKVLLTDLSDAAGAAPACGEVPAAPAGILRALVAGAALTKDVFREPRPKG